MKEHSYIGLKTCAAKLEKWITDFPCTDIRAAVSVVDWEQAPVVDLRTF
jgi:hypothetical protein